MLLPYLVTINSRRRLLVNPSGSQALPNLGILPGLLGAVLLYTSSLYDAQEIIGYPLFCFFVFFVLCYSYMLISAQKCPSARMYRLKNAAQRLRLSVLFSEKIELAWIRRTRGVSIAASVFLFFACDMGPHGGFV